MSGSEARKPSRKSGGSDTLTRLARYMGIRLILLFFTIVVGVYLTVLIANMGGYVDEIRRGEIRERIGAQFATLSPEMRQLSAEERKQLIERLVAQEEERLGLNQPFIIRSFRYLEDAITLRLGKAIQMMSDKGSREVKNILLERLPPTLMLWGLSNLILFFVTLFAALSLSRRYGSIMDKIVIALTPTSAAPAWFYGLFLILIFAAVLHLLPFGGMVDAPPPDNPLDYALSLAKHLILPTTAVMLSSFFLNTYNWRTFFLIYSSEDYVEMAKAKGLPDQDIERRYILRPTLPTIITNFALLVITLWTGAIILETVFNWPGLGRTLYRAIGHFDVPVIVGSTVIYAYLLAITVFVLDFIYALVDPRVRIGGEGRPA